MTTTQEPLIWEPGKYPELDGENERLWDAAYYRIVVTHHKAVGIITDTVGTFIHEVIPLEPRGLHEADFVRDLNEWLIVSAASELNGEPWETTINPGTVTETVITFNPATGIQGELLEVFIDGEATLLHGAGSRRERRLLEDLSNYINAPRARIPFTSRG